MPSQTLKTTEAFETVDLGNAKKVAVVVDREIYNAIAAIARQEMRSIRAQFQHIATEYIKRRTNNVDLS